ncbi:MAG: alpha-amylase/4-alpha-glucanotransferase domain-containing protein [Pirellulales bacterium]
MTEPLRLVLALHNHQPVGNFDGVIEQAYQESYKPFLDVFDRYPSIPIALHTSGCLMEWLDAHHPDYLDRLGEHVANGRMEIIGGAFYEAILPMIPPRDRVGQIQSYTRWLNKRLGANVRGMWMPERVWEQSLVSDLAQADIQYTLLDDFHFKNAGLTENQLHSYFVSEDDGRLVSIFPGSERLRYLIPFGQPQDTVEYLRWIASEHPGSVVVFGDDGEKFGVWPETHKHCYIDGWLTRFFDALAANQDWIRICTLADAVDNVAPNGKVYLPDSSYREMTEWSLPAEQLVRYEHVRREMEHDPRWPSLAQFVRGGCWRNFKVKYPEADEMYTRMMLVSQRLHKASEAHVQANGNGHVSSLLEAARTELYRGQCNCSYWHGAFGGIYLPHLRNAVYNHLIAADNLLDRAAGRDQPWVEAAVGDFNLDARQEVLLQNDKLVSLFAPVQGGQMYELDVRSICHNLLATITRRPEAYHKRVLTSGQNLVDNPALIHERVVFKQAGLDQRLQYDTHPRKSLLDHFYDNDAAAACVAAGKSLERGDFVFGVYEARLRRSRDRVQLVLSREGNAWGCPLRITKTCTLQPGSPALEIAYLLEGLPSDRALHFAVELNFAGLPSGADDRFFHNATGQRLGQLETRLDLAEQSSIGLADGWLGIDVQLNLSRPSGIWTFPIETVSQSEGGFELVHQSVAVLPHWIITPEADGTWRVTMTLIADTALAESRMEQAVAEAAAL